MEKKLYASLGDLTIKNSLPSLSVLHIKNGSFEDSMPNLRNTGGFMALCELTGKKPIVKNLVSHSHVKTKKKAQPNIQAKRLYSPALKGFVSLKVAASTIRSIEHVGGFDAFILQQDPVALSARALKIFNKIKSKSKSKSEKSK